MRFLLGRLAGAVAAIACAAACQLPARGEVEIYLEVAITDSGVLGFYRYDFRLVLGNESGTWVPGQGYGGIVFGDVPLPDAPSPISDFVLDPASIPVGPWTGVGIASGAHNGPALIPVVDGTLNPVIWTPGFVGDSLSWSGTSSYSNALCDLRFSSLFTAGGAEAADFVLIRCVPEPGPLTLGLIALPIVAARLATSRLPAGRTRR